MELFSSESTSRVYMMNFHILDSWAENFRGFQDTVVLDTSFLEQFEVHIKKSYRGSSRRQETRMQETVMFMKQLQSCERPGKFSKVESSLQKVAERTASNLWKKSVDYSIRSGLCTWMRSRDVLLVEK